MERSTYAADPAQVRGRHPADRRGGRPRRRASTTSATSAWTTSTRHEQAITAYALEGLADRARADRARPARRRPSAGERSPSRSTACTRTTWRTVLDTRGIAVRAGHHCAKPAHARFGVQSSTRMSSYLYTTPAEIDALVEGLEYTRSLLQVELSDHGPRHPVPGDHPGPLQEPPPRRACASPFEAEVHHVNPTCGDEVTLRVHLDADGRGRGRVVRRRSAARSRRPRRR